MKNKIDPSKVIIKEPVMIKESKSEPLKPLSESIKISAQTIGLDLTKVNRENETIEIVTPSFEYNIGQTIENIIKQVVTDTLNKSKNVEMPSDIVFTDNFGEILEKLIILTTRVWYLEDRIGELISLNDPKHNQEIVDLKKKIDICFKQKRPNYIQSLNKIVEAAILNGKKIEEDSVKIYKGY